ncbi:MAG: hypothetical protein IPO41_12065 [Acidobacteria bacterium]|jgi:hypothetical protein|nr:hypothetical protein [Acidobacteriota bacterium]MBK9529024.1 hypothetical protein [Acidobacteriota bacterium]MBP7474577.1 hypothetical protein [Pyrinomonadaceae bacterium]MBP9109577.1 hypothetical protein [Pyrinomonadaceae bacterium]
MLMYALIGLSLVLVGIVGLQFTYLFWIDRVYRERRTYLKDLEHRYADLNARLRSAELRIADQAGLLETLGYKDSETWADVIEER